MVCRFKPGQFVRRMREVGGLSFETAARAPITAVPDLPAVVPFVGDGYSRVVTLDEPFVALSLYDIINLATGELHVATRAALGQRFRIPPLATVILSGVDRDPKIERWGGNCLIAQPCSPGCATLASRSSPHRIPACSANAGTSHRQPSQHEANPAGMGGDGLAAALHLNARTDTDYGRWSRLIRDRGTDTGIALEFATGCGQGDRIDWHVQQLCQIAAAAGRSLSLVMRGGARKLPELRQHFARVTLVETGGFRADDTPTTRRAD